MKYRIVSGDFEFTGKEKNIILWDSFFKDKKNNIISIIYCIEKKPSIYRQKFYDLVYEISRKKIGDKLLLDYLNIEKGLSFFWFTNIGQRDNISQFPELNDIIKSFCLIEIIEKKKIQEMHLEISKKILHEQIKSICSSKNLRITFENNYGKINKTKLLNPLKVVLYSFYFYFKRVGFKRNKFSKSDFLLFDFFIGESISNSKFSSKYYTKLTDLMPIFKLSYNYAHLFFKSINNKNLIEIDKKLRKFNNHVIDRETNLYKVGYSLIKYFSLLRKTFFLRKSKNLFFSTKHKIDFKYLIEKNFFDSLTGINSIKNLNYNELIKSYVKKNNDCSYGIYIFENQPWELILNYHWKKNNNYNLFAMVHTTVRFWDLRMFYGNKFLNSNLIPTKILSNSKYSKIELINGGYSVKSIDDVEALRYLKTDNELDIERKSSTDIKKLLVCGDFNSKTNKILVDIGQDVQSKSNCKVDFLPHPTQKFLSQKNNLNLINNKLQKIINNYNYILTSSISSSSVEAIEYGKVVFQLLEKGSLNFSPLKNLNCTIFITSANDIINHFKKNKKIKTEKLNFFYENIKLNKWKNFLGKLIQTRSPLN